MKNHMKKLVVEIDIIYYSSMFKPQKGDHCSRDRMVVGFTTTYAINAFHY